MLDFRSVSHVEEQAADFLELGEPDQLQQPSDVGAVCALSEPAHRNNKPCVEGGAVLAEEEAVAVLFRLRVGKALNFEGARRVGQGARGSRDGDGEELPGGAAGAVGLDVVQLRL